MNNKKMQKALTCALAVSMIAGTGAVLSQTPVGDTLSISVSAAQNTIYDSYGQQWEYERDSNYIKLLRCVNASELNGSVTLPGKITGYAGVSYDVNRIFRENNGKGIKKLTFDSSVKKIEANMCREMPDLTEVVIKASGVASIDNDAFYGCKKLKTVTVGSGVQTIGNNAFTECTSLTKITLPNSVTSIGAGAFSKTGLTQFEFPSGVKLIPANIFNGSPISSITGLSSNITNIRNDAFKGCSKLASIDLSKTKITTVYDFFGSGSLISSIKLPNTVTKITDLRSCKKLTNFVVPSSVETIDSDALNTGATLNIRIDGNNTNVDKGAFGDKTSSTLVRLYSGEKAKARTTDYKNPRVYKFITMYAKTSVLSTTKMKATETNTLKITEVGGRKTLKVKAWLENPSKSSDKVYICGSASAYGTPTRSSDAENGDHILEIDFKNVKVGTWLVKYVIQDYNGWVDGTYTYNGGKTKLKVESSLTLIAPSNVPSNAYNQIYKEKSQKTDYTLTATGNSGTVTYWTEYAKKNGSTYGAWQTYDKNVSSSTRKQTIDFSKFDTGDYKIRFAVKDSSKTVRTREYNLKIYNNLSLTTGFTGTTVSRDDTITISNMQGSGGSGDYQYTVIVTKPDGKTRVTVRDYAASNSASFVPSANNLGTGQHKVTMQCKDMKTGQLKAMSCKINIISDTINSSYIQSGGKYYLGENITICGRVKGTTESVQYKYEWYDDEKDAWAVIKNFSETKDQTFRPTRNGRNISGYFTVRVTAKIGSTKVREKYINCRVYDQIYNSCSMSANEIVAGQSTTIKLAGTGVEKGGQFKYDIYYKKQSAGTNAWTTAYTNVAGKDTNDKTVTLTPNGGEGVYTIKIVAKETHNGTTRKSTKTLNLVVNAK